MRWPVPAFLFCLHFFCLQPVLVRSELAERKSVRGDASRSHQADERRVLADGLGARLELHSDADKSL